MRNIFCRCNMRLSSSTLFQRINISTRLCTSSSSSSSTSDSSDSSDSDSDTEKTKLETSKDNVKSMSPASTTSDDTPELEKFLYNMTQVNHDFSSISSFIRFKIKVIFHIVLK